MQVTVPSTDAANKPHGMLRPGPLRSRNREWVGTVTWKPFHAAEPDYELRLGESVHIEGLGTVTLLEVNPPPAIPEINFFRERNGLFVFEGVVGGAYRLV